MSYPHRVARVTLSGTMFNGAEQWSTGFFMGSEIADASPVTEQGVADIGLAFQTFFKAPANSISSAYQFTTCKVHMVNNDGKAMPDTATYWSPPTTALGGGSSNALPPQIALVATLANSLPRGLATKGRMFLPGINLPIAADGHIAAASVATIGTNLATFFNSIKQDADTPGYPVLASLGRGALLQGGAIRRVVNVRIGNVYDTQRRRRNALVESYSTAALS